MLPKRIVHVVDDDPALRQALDELIHAAGFESALYATPSAFLSIAASASGCLLLDLKMPEMTGLEVQQRLAEMGVRFPVIVMTALSDVPTAVKAMKAGAVDFIEKPFDDKRLIAAIETAFGSAAVEGWEEEGMEAAKRIASLSPRERAVLDALMVGRTNKQIAYDLDISVRTVEAHRARMLERLETHGLAEAVRLAVLANLFHAGFKAGPGWR